MPAEHLSLVSEKVLHTADTLVSAACRGHERLRFGYRDRANTPSRRAVEPYRLVRTSSDPPELVDRVTTIAERLTRAANTARASGDEEPVT